MTSQEMSLEFDILYNNIASNMAPGIDSFEKSVFLTKAQEQLVTAIYDGSFEGSEKLRECINPLVITTNPQPTTGVGLSSDSKFFLFPDDAWYIVYESITPKNTETCVDGKTINVIPIKVDEYHRIRKNPFRKARKSEAIRLNSEGKLEIISIYPEYDYSIRYIRKPQPIIIGTGQSDLTIDGISTEFDSDYDGQGSELLEAIHRTIVESAVTLAIATYKSNTNN